MSYGLQHLSIEHWSKNNRVNNSYENTLLPTLSDNILLIIFFSWGQFTSVALVFESENNGCTCKLHW